ncbi:uncharacterized protein A1O5_07406 [Cladophialophora psammophila CBS 110553]|uniref:Uncharacterized protein n=1 Tax=Cladophialophora psammophila CBS 110553 TaxID=1182543 RepID=W9WWG8_9EURO|nr:uncharacterized protein A1O5_07406 [Cladophialophora psammophila CBS 110553]EXJ69370.1 hypothetical protein A1O5_07406 [Cladophialophora psammophila CBS 110553]
MCAALILAGLTLAGVAQAHIAAFAKGMYCENGADPSNPNFNSNAPVAPLYNLTQDQWWFQHDRGCDAVPPPPGVFLELPAGGSFDVDLANNQAFSNLSYGGSKVSEWPDGGTHPEDWNGGGVGEGCIQDGGYMHVQNQSMTQGTAFAIAYESDLSAITLEDLVVFTVLEHTPWKRAATYQVPAAMPACPEGGCTCAWLWVPRGCGQPNIYMQGFKCVVTGATSTIPLGKAQAPVMCDTDPSKCVKGAKQMIVWNQLTGNNVVTTGSQTPAYNTRNGFTPGPQDDIFEGAPSTPGGPASSSTTSSNSIFISATAPAATHVQSWTTSAAGTSSSGAISMTPPTTSSSVSPSWTTLATVVKPASTTSSIASIPAAPESSSSVSRGSPSPGSPETVTVSVTVTVSAAGPTQTGLKHFKECWVEIDEELDN